MKKQLEEERLAEEEQRAARKERRAVRSSEASGLGGGSSLSLSGGSKRQRFCGRSPEHLRMLLAQTLCEKRSLL